jgi:hypothetical protein
MFKLQICRNWNQVLSNLLNYWLFLGKVWEGEEDRVAFSLSREFLLSISIKGPWSCKKEVLASLSFQGRKCVFWSELHFALRDVVNPSSAEAGAYFWLALISPGYWVFFLPWEQEYENTELAKTQKHTGQSRTTSFQRYLKSQNSFLIFFTRDFH